MLHSFPQLQDRYKRIVNGYKGLFNPFIESFVTMFFSFFVFFPCTLYWQNILVPVATCCQSSQLPSRFQWRCWNGESKEIYVVKIVRFMSKWCDQLGKSALTVVVSVRRCCNLQFIVYWYVWIVGWWKQQETWWRTCGRGLAESWSEVCFYIGWRTHFSYTCCCRGIGNTDCGHKTWGILVIYWL